jgi:hypothetical protein
MYQAFEATIDSAGNVKLKEQAQFSAPRRAIVLVLDESGSPVFNETALLSEAALAVDWNRAEEDAAWAYLQSEK